MHSKGDTEPESSSANSPPPHFHGGRGATLQESGNFRVGAGQEGWGGVLDAGWLALGSLHVQGSVTDGAGHKAAGCNLGTAFPLCRRGCRCVIRGSPREGGEVVYGGLWVSAPFWSSLRPSSHWAKLVAN